MPNLTFHEALARYHELKTAEANAVSATQKANALGDAADIALSKRRLDDIQDALRALEDASTDHPVTPIVTRDELCARIHETPARRRIVLTHETNAELLLNHDTTSDTLVVRVATGSITRQIGSCLPLRTDEFYIERTGIEAVLNVERLNRDGIAAWLLTW